MGAMKPGLVLTDRRTGLPSVRFAGAPLLRPRYLLRHTFSGAGLTPSDQGPSLADNEGTSVVSGGVLSKSGSGAMTPTTVTLAANVVAQCKVNFGNSAGTDRRLELRLRDDGSSNLVSARILLNDNTLNVWRRDAGAITVLAAVSGLGMTNNTDYWLRFAAIGSRLEAWTSTDGMNWTSRAVVSEPTYMAQRGFSIRLVDNVASPTITVDDLLVWTP